MTNNKPNDVRVVPVELLERLCMRPRKDSSAVNHQDIVDRGQAQAELRAILAQPADQQGEPVAVVVEETHNYGQYLVFGEGLRGVHSPRPVVERKAHLLDQTLPTGTKLYDQPATAKVVLPERETLKDVMAAVIGGDAYDCTRVWNAWGVGTMTDDDFVPIVEQEERLYELVDACLDEVAKLNTPQ